MKTNGSAYVAVVIAVLGAYFAYMWWFNPQRAIKRQLGELAAALSVPAGSADQITPAERVARLRRYFADDIHVSADPAGREITSRDALLAAIAAWTPPPGGVNVDVVDVQVTLDSEVAARAYLTVEITAPDPLTGRPSMDKREMKVSVAERDATWIVTRAEPQPPLGGP